MSLYMLKLFSYFTFLFSALLHSSETDRSLFGNSELLSDLFIKRHSGTDFDDRPLTEDQIQALIQAARWSPSSYNDQPWNFILCNRYTTPEAYLKVQDSIYGQEWTENVPFFAIVILRKEFSYNGEVNEWAQYDTGAAALAMSLQATEMGLMAHQIGGFDQENIRENFQIPQGYDPLVIIAIGYENSAAPSGEEIRTRCPVNKNFFIGQWGS